MQSKTPGGQMDLLNGLIQHRADTSTLQPLKPRTLQSDTR
jgi:hypothetical protein